ncbi:phosphoribosyl-AMP cyclohydrolase [Microbacterium halophytorum]|uniref:phosphoribosyl-AMP cyclohydrolase n=1 Tax=Microbacterium halophytorum TaxID=2067568 RepID=UPI000CFC1ACB|nr:phosphoribosyl-AMP cyclohydrolase [Microbacterium halophytorum]
MTGVDERIDRVRFTADGLVPAVVQQYDSREVLMMAWMNRESLRLTLTTGRAVYWSRSRGELWRKGDTSGHTQRVVSARVDCDADTVLLEVDQEGAACHTGTRTCFDTGEHPERDLAPVAGGA